MYLLVFFYSWWKEHALHCHTLPFPTTWYVLLVSWCYWTFHNFTDIYSVIKELFNFFTVIHVRENGAADAMVCWTFNWWSATTNLSPSPQISFQPSGNTSQERNRKPWWHQCKLILMEHIFLRKLWKLLPRTIQGYYDVFTLPDTETEKETDKKWVV